MSLKKTGHHPVAHLCRKGGGGGGVGGAGGGAGGGGGGGEAKDVVSLLTAAKGSWDFTYPDL